MRASTESEATKNNSHIYKIDFPLKENFQLRKKHVILFLCNNKNQTGHSRYFFLIVRKKNYHKIGQSKYKNRTVSWTDFYSISVFHREKSKEKKSGTGKFVG